MAIFGLTQQTIQTALGIIDQSDKLADKAYDLIDVAEVALDDGPKALLALKNGIQGLITMNGNAIMALRNNPIARGPWRILVVMVVGILRGFGFVLGGLKIAVKGLINFLRSTAIKKLKKKLVELKQELIKYTATADKLKQISMYLYSLATFLETQQTPLEKKYTWLKVSVRDNQLKQINDTLKEIEKILKDINSSIVDITSKIDEIKKLFNKVNAITGLMSSVVNAINSILGFVNTIFRRIKSLIASIPGIGWLLGSLNKIIDWALDKLGVKRLLQSLGASFKNLPFIKAVYDFIKSIKDKVEALIVSINLIITEFINNILKTEEIKQLNDTVIIIFSQLNLKKIVQEFYMPEWVNLLLEKVRAEQKDIKENELQPSDIKKSYDKTVKEIHTMATLLNVAPDQPIVIKNEVKIRKGFGELLSATILPDNAKDNEDLTNYVSRFEEIESHLNNLSSLYIESLSKEYTQEYFEEGINLYKQLADIHQSKEYGSLINKVLKNL